MGRNRKNILEEENKEQQVEEAVTEEENVPAETPEAVNAPEPEEENVPADEHEEAQTVSSSELPQSVINTLRIFNAYDELYITPWGGVFTKPLPARVKDAVLYKNPFFKKQ